MKLLICLILALLFTGCATKKLSYAEEVEIRQRKYIDAQIDSDLTLTEDVKDFKKKVTICMREIVPNPYTIRNLMNWQKDAIYFIAEEECKSIVQEIDSD